MSLSDRELLELNELCNRLVDGTLEGPARARLEAMLDQSEAAREFYIRALSLSASLFEYAAELQVEAPNVVRLPAVDRNGRWGLKVSLAAAAGLLLALVLQFQFRTNSVVVAAVSEESVARISALKDCHWVGAMVENGDELQSGQRLEIASGWLEVTFDSGAQVTLEGPASLELRSAWEAALEHGTLKAKVPSEAIGFRVTNPAVEIVDLGTEFSLIADRGGAAEVFVLKGSVEARQQPGSGDSLLLHENEARRFFSAGISEVTDREQKLSRLKRKLNLEQSLGEARYWHWAFDGEPQTGDLRTLELVQSEPISQVTGRWGQAWSFEGKNSAHAELPGGNQMEAQTLACWVQIPAEAEISNAGVLLTSKFGGQLGRRYSIGWNHHPGEGAMGALRTDFGRGFTVGSTSLRDGQWHHLAVVLGKLRPNGKAQVKQYVDGRLEGVSARRGGKRRELEAVSGANALWVGQGPDQRQGGFRGKVDELYLVDRALSPAEIKHLREFNRPLGGTVLAAQ